MKKTVFLSIILTLILLFCSCGNAPKETYNQSEVASKPAGQMSEKSTEKIVEITSTQMLETTGQAEVSTASSSKASENNPADSSEDAFVATTPLMKVMKPELEEGDLNYSYLFSQNVNCHVVHAYGGFWFAQEEIKDRSEIYYYPDDERNEPLKVCSIPVSIEDYFYLLPTNRGRDLYILVAGHNARGEKLLHYNLVQEVFRDEIETDVSLYISIPYCFGSDDSLFFSASSFAVTDSKICILQASQWEAGTIFDMYRAAENIGGGFLMMIIDTHEETVNYVETGAWMEKLPEWILEGKEAEKDKPAIYTCYSDIGLNGVYRYYLKMERDFANREYLQGETDGIYRIRWDKESEEELVLSLPCPSLVTNNHKNEIIILAENYLLEGVRDYDIKVYEMRDKNLCSIIGGFQSEEVYALENDRLWYQTWDDDGTVHVMNLSDGLVKQFINKDTLNTSIDIVQVFDNEGFFFPWEDNIYAGDANHLYRISQEDPRRNYELLFQTVDVPQLCYMSEEALQYDVEMAMLTELSHMQSSYLTMNYSWNPGVMINMKNNYFGLVADHEIIDDYNSGEWDKLRAVCAVYTSASSKETAQTDDVKYLIIVNEELREDVVYEMVKILCENAEALASEHPIFGQMTDPDFLAKDLPIPLHPGAERYYREIGAIR